MTAETSEESVITCEDVRECLRYRYGGRADWIFLEELRSGTGYDRLANGYMDGFAMNCYPSKGFERIAFEIKVNKSDFYREIKKPMKRKVALLYSNRFYFVTPPGLLKPDQIPPECGLLELSEHIPSEWELRRPVGKHRKHDLKYAVEAPWRDTPPPSWSLVASMARSLQAQQREAAR